VAAGLPCTGVVGLRDRALEERLYGPPRPASKGRAEPDLLYVHTELRRAGVTLELLHLEYLREHPEGYRYTAYCDRYRVYQKRLGVWMRQVHRGGEKAFVDYSARGPVSLTRPRAGASMWSSSSAYWAHRALRLQRRR
jgi:transposase